MQNGQDLQPPANPSLKLSKADEKSIYADQKLYQSVVGKLLYLTIQTRPDIAFAASTVTKFTSKPTEQYWKAVKHILRYITGTINVYQKWINRLYRLL